MDNKKMSYVEIAQKLGVSRTTVSRAMSGKGRIGKETKKMIREYAVNVCGYPDLFFEEKKNMTNNIALVIPSNWRLIDLPFFQRCMIGITEIAMLNNYDTIIVMAGDRDVGSLERIVNNHKADGYVLARTYVDDVFVKYLKEAKVPFVTIGSIDDPEVIQIDNDHEEACRDMVSTMVLRGMRKIAMIGNNRSHMVTNARFNGYCSGLEDNHIGVNPDYVFLDVHNKLKAEKIVDEIIMKKIDGILCMDDTLCRWILTKLRREHMRVPGQVKVASCYDSEVLEDYTPSITSIRFDAIELGSVACKVLLDLIQGNRVDIRTLLGYEIIFRDSTK